MIYGIDNDGSLMACLICDSEITCPHHERPEQKVGEPFYTCSICEERILQEETKQHSDTHIQEAVMMGIRDYDSFPLPMKRLMKVL